MRLSRLLVLIAVAATALALATPTAVAADLDLDVTKIEPLVAPVCAGSSPTLRAYIRNNGSAESGFFGIRWEADGQIFDGGHFSIPAGATDTHDHIWSQGSVPPISQGQHTIRFIADFGNGIAETDESNNESTLTFEAVPCPVPLPDKYVALGDSFSSGDGALDYIPSSGACRQSNNAYPSLLARGLIPDTQIPSNLIFYACSGDKVRDVTNNQLPLFRVIDASSVKLVTITVGGNDVDFGGVLAACYGGLVPEAATAGCLRQSSAVARTIANLRAPLLKLYRTIKAAAPEARLLVLGYPDLFPRTPTGNCSGFSATSQRWFNTQEQVLNSLIRTAASQTGAEFVSTYGSFAGHNICSSDPYVNGFPSPTFEQRAFHPKPIGQLKLASVVGDYLRARPTAP